MRVKDATIVCDPISTKASVQIRLVTALCDVLRNEYAIQLISPNIPIGRIREMEDLGISQFINVSESKPILSKIYNTFSKNESMLWSVSWITEALFRTNSTRLEVLDLPKQGIIINLGYTIPFRSDIYWNQATPPLITIREAGRYNSIFKVISVVFGSLIELLDKKIRGMHWKLTRCVLSPSKYIKELYEERHLSSHDVLYDPRSFETDFDAGSDRTRDYVLAYIGKEVELDTILEVTKFGMKVIAFGSKVPVGTSISGLKEVVDYRGYVTDKQLAELYHDALFTAFPFTEEPFGWVPIESMHYGTPVLTYNKQGPSETVIDNVTGWLVEDATEFLEKAEELCRLKKTGIDPKACSDRASDFSIDRFGAKLKSIMNSLD